MFYGRDDELEELNRRYRTKGFQFIPVYGRRRVGKTALIDEFIKDKTAIKFTAVKGSYNTNMRLLSSIVLGVKNAPVMEFENILEVMHSRFGGGRYIFVIDEYPYLVGSDESVTGILNLRYVQKYDYIAAPTQSSRNPGRSSMGPPVHRPHTRPWPGGWVGRRR